VTAHDDAARWGAEELLLRVAWHYYKDELTQDEIARRLSMSRASVGRLLDRARKVGLVSISINSDYLSSFRLSAQLCERFGLTEALVVPDYGGQPLTQRAMNSRLGMGGAQYLNTRLRSGGSIGVGWGDTVAKVISAADLGAFGAMHMVTLTGGVDGYLQALAFSRADDSDAQGDALTASVIPSPIVASTPTLAAALKAEPTIQQVLQQARNLQHAIVGVGTPAPDATLVRNGYLSAAEARVLTEMGVVGDILGQFFDIDGKVLDLPIHERRIGIELADLRAIGRVVGVAGGAAKTSAILGALHGGFLNVLVTNEAVARELLSLTA
jgi:lsr operon transcriptional repressor